MGEGFLKYSFDYCKLQYTLYYASYAGIIRIRFTGRRFTCLSAVYNSSPVKQKQETAFRMPPVKNPCV